MKSRHGGALSPCGRGTVLREGLAAPGPHPTEIVAMSELPSPARGEGATTRTAFAALIAFYFFFRTFFPRARRRRTAFAGVFGFGPVVRAD